MSGDSATIETTSALTAANVGCSAVSPARVAGAWLNTRFLRQITPLPVKERPRSETEEDATPTDKRRNKPTEEKHASG